MLATNKQGHTYLVSDRPHRRWTKEEEVVFFKQIDAEEQKLYVMILSYLPLGLVTVASLTLSLNDHKESTPEFERSIKLITNYLEKGKLTKVQQRTFKRLVNKMTREFRLLEAPRSWAKSITFGVTNTDEFLQNDAYEGFFKIVKDDEYRKWGRMVNGQAEFVQKMKNDFIEDNTGLIGSIVSKRIRGGYLSIPQTDLMQEGTFGLLKAVNKFDYTMGIKFSTYAAWWVRHAVTRAIHDKDRMIRVPVHISDKAYRVRTIMYDYQALHGELPSVEYLAESVNTTAVVVKSIIESIKIFSMDAPITTSEDDAHDWYGVTADPKANTAMDVVCDNEVKSFLIEAMKGLSARERAVIRG